MVTKFKKRIKRESFFLPTFLIILMLTIATFLVISNWKMNQKRAELSAKIEALKKEIQIIEEKNRELRKEISQVGTRGYLEKVAKEQLNLKNPGEEVVVVKKEIKPPEKKEEKKSFWQKIWEKIRF